MPPISISADVLRPFGEQWARAQRLEKKEGMDLSDAIATQIGPAFAEFLGGLPLIPGRLRRLQPDLPDGAKEALEVADILVVGGIRPQHFDIGYRPDGVRIVVDVKTLNTRDSVGKNYPNMINDLTAEATTVHTRFPYALVAFVVAVPKPCLEPNQTKGLVRRLEGLGHRDGVDGAAQLAEAIALVVWDPATGAVDQETPPNNSPIRIENFSVRIERIYVERYDGAAPHVAAGTRVRLAAPESPDETLEAEAIVSDDDDDAGDARKLDPGKSM